jgi:oligopeptide transport system substrate-binding protein
MLTKKLTSAAILLLVGSILLTACQAKAQEPVTYNGWSKYDIPTLDPQLADDVISVGAVENLFLQLTNYDPHTAQIVPEAATRWEISDDGLTYTFHIRTDVPWVKHDPATGSTSQQLDAQGNPRFLTAHDFVYGIQRACDPNTGSYYSTIVAPQIKGCEDILFFKDPEHIPQALWDAVGVHAPDDGTLVIQLEFPASYFLSMTPLWTLAAVPHWTIEEHGQEWIKPDNIVTNGRFVLQEWKNDVRRIFLRNPLIPADLHGNGNIQRIVFSVLEDCKAGYALWLENKVDASCIPNEQMETHLERFADETDQVTDLSVNYISFRMTKPPFDDPRVRRAFSAAFDRDTFVKEVLKGQGIPMIHFAPPGIFGAPPVDEVGLSFDPQFAREQLAAAGYPNCQGFPRVTIVSYREQDPLLEFAKDQWMTNLGCSADVIQVETRAFRETMDLTMSDAPDTQAPNMWKMGWVADYADENNWVGAVLWCKTHTREKRTCNEIDDLIVQARQETDSQLRIQLYRQIEELFFGPQGEIPFVPIYTSTTYTARHTWLEPTHPPFGGEQWYTWSIDQEAQQAARR